MDIADEHEQEILSTGYEVEPEILLFLTSSYQYIFSSYQYIFYLQQFNGSCFRL